MKKQFFIFALLAFLVLGTGKVKLSSAEENLTLTFYQAKLSHVLQSLSRMTGTKLITSAELGEKNISVYLADVPGQEAIDSILEANSLYREKIPGSDIYIVKELKASTPDLKSETFFLNHAKAEDLGNILAPLLRDNGQIMVDKRTNSITIRDLPPALAEFQDIIDSLDRSAPQVSIEAVLVELTTDRLKDLGINWNLEGNFFGPAQDVSAPWSKKTGLEVVGPTTGTTSGTTTASGPQFIMGRLSFESLTANLRS